MTPDLSELAHIQKNAEFDNLQLLEFIIRLIREKDPLIDDIKRVLDWPAMRVDDQTMPVDLEKYLRVLCPKCDASVGQACQDNNSTWVHLERINRYVPDAKSGD